VENGTTESARPRPAWRRPLLWGGAGAALGVAALGAWVGWTGQQARSELLAARSSLPAVQAAVLAGDGSAAGKLDALRRHAASADDLTHDPVWSLVSAVPVVGTPAATTQGLTRSVDALAGRSLPALARAADTVHPAKVLDGGGRLDVSGLASAEPALREVATSLREERDAVAKLDRSWLGPVGDARDELLGQLGSLAATSRDAATAARVLPPMLGLDGSRRYFVAFQNPAEARATGGLLDAFAVVSADHGTVHIDRMGANTQLPALTAEVTDVDPGFADRYASVGATSAWLEANVSPNFPDVARAWLAMWTQSTGQRLDGVIALDPRALAGVLAATGPVTAPVVGTVDAKRIEPLVLHDQYVLPQLGTERKSLMLGVGSATITKLLAGGVSPRALLPALQDAARTGHVLVNSRFPEEQAKLVDAGIGGAVDTSARPFAQAVVVNAAGNKLDSWLDSSLKYAVTSCSPDKRTVDVSVTLRNGAPKTGLPPYMTVRTDRPVAPTVTGQNRSELQVFVTRGATLLGATLDGAPLLQSDPEGSLPTTVQADAAPIFLSRAETGGRPSFWLNLETPPGGTHTMVLRLQEPPSTAAPLLPRQALVRDTAVSADVSSCAGAR
jgi:Protein of unknown function (DUF4012)